MFKQSTLTLVLLTLLSSSLQVTLKTSQTQPANSTQQAPQQIIKENLPLTVPDDWLPKLKAKTSTFNFTVDEFPLGIYINHNKIPFQFSDWHSKRILIAKTLKLNLFKGDLLTIVGVNKIVFAGMLGSLQFVNEKGEEKIYNTGPDWFCNGKPAVITAKNDGKYQTDYNVIANIPKNANFIWTKENVIDKEVTCEFIIPCE